MTNVCTFSYSGCQRTLARTDECVGFRFLACQSTAWWLWHGLGIGMVESQWEILLRNRRSLLSFHLDLFAPDDDFSWETIANGRNRYYQRQLAQQINNQMIETISLLSSALNIHLNLGQQSTMNTSSLFLSLETVSLQSLSKKVIHPLGQVQIQLPSKVDHYSGNAILSVRVSLRLISYGMKILFLSH